MTKEIYFLQDAVASLYGAFPLEGFSQADVRQLGLDDGTLADDFLLAAAQQPGPGAHPSAPAAADSPFVFGRNGAVSGATAAPQPQQQVLARAWRCVMRSVPLHINSACWQPHDHTL